MADELVDAGLEGLIEESLKHYNPNAPINPEWGRVVEFMETMGYLMEDGFGIEESVKIAERTMSFDVDIFGDE